MEVFDCAELFDINCSGNRLELLDLSNNENVEILDCSFNKIKNIKIYTPSIWLLDCEYNYLLDFSFLENIQNSDKIIYFQNQKPLPGGHFNENDINILKKIYQNNNVEELEWDFNSPEELMGITWIYKNGKYYIEQIDLSNRNIKGSIEGELIELKKLDVSDTKIKEIKLIALNLQELVCQNAELINLDLVTPNLKTIFCQYNSLSEETVNNILNLKNDYEIATVSPQFPDIQRGDLCVAEKEVLLSFAGEEANNESLQFLETDPAKWDRVVWTLVDNEYHISEIDISYTDLSGTLDLSQFVYLDKFNIIDSTLPKLILPFSESKIDLYTETFFKENEKYGTVIEVAHNYSETEINVNGVPLSGTLYMDAFDYLNQLDIDNTKLEYLILPKNDFAYQWIQLYYAGSIKCETLKNVQIAGVAR